MAANPELKVEGLAGGGGQGHAQLGTLLVHVRDAGGDGPGAEGDRLAADQERGVDLAGRRRAGAVVEQPEFRGKIFARDPVEAQDPRAPQDRTVCVRDRPVGRLGHCGKRDDRVVGRVGPRLVETPAGGRAAAGLLATGLLVDRLQADRLEQLAAAHQLFEGRAWAEVMVDLVQHEPGVLVSVPRPEALVGLPGRPPARREKLGLRDDGLEHGDRGGAWDPEFHVGSGLAFRVERKHVIHVAVHPETVVAMADIENGRGGEEGAARVEVEAVAVEQPDGKGLPGHARPGVEELVAAAPDGKRGLPPQAQDDGPRLPVEDGEIGGGSLVEVAGERELLPDHDAALRAELEEAVLVHKPATPASQEV